MNKHAFKIIVLFIFSSLAFAYVDVLGFRIVPLYILSICFLLFSYGFSLINDKRSFSYIFLMSSMLVFIVFSYLVSGDAAVLFAFIFFFLLSVWPIFIARKYLVNLSTSYLDGAYIFFSIVASLGLVVQYLLYTYAGIELGRVVSFLNRTAFSFTWQDFSFLSLFLFSSVPLAFSKSKSFGVLVLFLSFVGSIVTTGRTGLFSFFVFVIIWLLWCYFKALMNFKINKFVALVPPFIVVSPFVYAYLTVFLGVRNIRLDDAGRFQGYLNSFNSYLESNLLFGRFFDVNYYRENVDIIPHNLLLYMLVFGGLFFTLVF